MDTTAYQSHDVFVWALQAYETPRRAEPVMKALTSILFLSGTWYDVLKQSFTLHKEDPLGSYGEMRRAIYLSPMTSPQPSQPHFPSPETFDPHILGLWRVPVESEKQRKAWVGAFQSRRPTHMVHQEPGVIFQESRNDHLGCSITWCPHVAQPLHSQCP
jgi:hypothetical protein